MPPMEETMTTSAKLKGSEERKEENFVSSIWLWVSEQYRNKDRMELLKHANDSLGEGSGLCRYNNTHDN